MVSPRSDAWARGGMWWRYSRRGMQTPDVSAPRWEWFKFTNRFPLWPSIRVMRAAKCAQEAIHRAC
jgi:hypothetical protein